MKNNAASKTQIRTAIGLEVIGLLNDMNNQFCVVVCTDNVNIQIDGVLYLRVVEPYKVRCSGMSFFLVSLF